MKLKFLFLIILAVSTTFQCENDEANDSNPQSFTPTIWTQGDGTITNPYLIENAEQLVYLSITVNNTITTEPNYTDNRFVDKYFKIINDINMENIEFEPIGKSSSFNFSGHLDGNSKVISNLSIVSTSESDATGLFGYVDGNLKNIILTNSEIFGVNNVGGIVGHLSQFRKIEMCSINGTVNGKMNVGGIAGYVTLACVTEMCVFSGDVSGETNIGGIIGYLYSGIISKCINEGNVVSTESFSGGIIGTTYEGYIEKCLNKGFIRSQNTVGGLIGCFSGPNYITPFRNEIRNSYNTGDVKSTNGIASGIVGFQQAGLINYTYTSGYIDSDNPDLDLVNPIAANSYSSTTYYSFFLYGSVENYFQFYSDYGVPESYMKSADIITELQYNQTEIIWKRDSANQINNGFPYLAWEDL